MKWLLTRYPEDGHAKKDSSKTWFNAPVYPRGTVLLFSECNMTEPVHNNTLHKAWDEVVQPGVNDMPYYCIYMEKVILISIWDQRKGSRE